MTRALDVIGDTVIVTFPLHHRLLRFIDLPWKKDLTPTYQDVTSMGMDHRWGQRQSTDVTVRVVARSGMTHVARVANVSLTGAYLETSAPLRLHSLVHLEPSAQDHALINGNRVAANVVRRDERGIGLEWCEALTKRAHIDALLVMLGNSETVDGSAPAWN